VMENGSLTVSLVCEVFEEKILRMIPVNGNNPRPDKVGLLSGKKGSSLPVYSFMLMLQSY